MAKISPMKCSLIRSRSIGMPIKCDCYKLCLSALRLRRLKTLFFLCLSQRSKFVGLRIFVSNKDSFGQRPIWIKKDM